MMTPIKPIKITDRILYNKDGQYNMISLSKNKLLGYIALSPKKDTLYISKLKSYYPENKKLKVGTSLINFAKKMSKKMGFDGKLNVIAYKTDYWGKDPHKFYRKQGFTTNNPKMDEMLDFCIDYNIDIPPYMKQGVSMDYKG